MRKGTSGIEDFEIVFGMFFVGTPMIAVFAEAISTAGDFSGANEFLKLTYFLFIFFLVGMLFLMDGIARNKRNWDTKRKGFVGYGQITFIEPSGVLINNEPQLKALVRTYIPQLNVIINLDEVVGVGESPYDIDSIVAVKYWDFDINILGVVEDTSSLPVKVQEVLLGRVVVNEEKNDNAWDKLDTENWTLTEEAFPEDMGITRQKDDMSYSDDESPVVLRKPVITRKDITAMWARRVLTCAIMYAGIVVVLVKIKFGIF